jgi:hypothetical protein
MRKYADNKSNVFSSPLDGKCLEFGCLKSIDPQSFESYSNSVNISRHIGSFWFSHYVFTKPPLTMYIHYGPNSS